MVSHGDNSENRLKIHCTSPLHNNLHHWGWVFNQCSFYNYCWPLRATNDPLLWWLFILVLHSNVSIHLVVTFVIWHDRVDPCKKWSSLCTCSRQNDESLFCNWSKTLVDIPIQAIFHNSLYMFAKTCLFIFEFRNLLKRLKLELLLFTKY